MSSNNPSSGGGTGDTGSSNGFSSSSSSVNNLLNAIAAAAVSSSTTAAAAASGLSPPPPPPQLPSTAPGGGSQTVAAAPPQSSTLTSLPLSSSLPSSLSTSLSSIVIASSPMSHQRQQPPPQQQQFAATAATSGAATTVANLISVSSLASSSSASSSSSSSSSSTSSTVSNPATNTASNPDTKMETSFTSSQDINMCSGLGLMQGGSLAATPGSGIYVGDIISRLYPNVNQSETPLPRQWSAKDKCQSLSLSMNNLRVTYKGPGKSHKDAASVRTDFPIPAACGIYYFEVKVLSKGRDGYMGIGLSKSDVLLSRLPGWDKNSYGYHGDDGHSFCCSGTGQNYGPTFTTDDVIGCCLNLIENTCFYTKNGYNLGIAFRDLPNDLYPTVGLQTPGESIEANFGQYPFEFDIHNYVKEWHMKTRQTIERFPLHKDTENNLPTILRKLISTYLVHHGYSSTAEAFAKSVGHVFEEELASIRNRQRIQKSVLNGCLDEAIELTYQLFPGILERNANLLFALKVRQFIEMINQAHRNTSGGAQQQQCQTDNQEAASYLNNTTNNNGHYVNHHNHNNHQSGTNHRTTANNNHSNNVNSHHQQLNGVYVQNTSNSSNSIHSGGENVLVDLDTNSQAVVAAAAAAATMIVDSDDTQTVSVAKFKNGFSSNGFEDDDEVEEHNDDEVTYKNNHFNHDEEMDLDSSPKHTYKSSSSNSSVVKNLLEPSNETHLQKILELGRDLFQMNSAQCQMPPDGAESSYQCQTNTKMLRDAISLLAYHDPWNSPLGYQLDASQREPISAMLNSAILEANNMPRIPPLEVIYAQTNECLRLMGKFGIPWCAYVNLADYMQS